MKTVRRNLAGVVCMHFMPTNEPVFYHFGDSPMQALTALHEMLKERATDVMKALAKAVE
jgi:hypothetical protein